MAHRTWPAFALLVLLCFSTQHQPVLDMSQPAPYAAPSNPTGVDLEVTDVSIAYTSNADVNSYRMFSSNHPIAGFNRPANLYVIDGMVDTGSTLTVTVENIGTANSGVVDITVTLLHDEYAFFEFVNSTVQMNGLAPSAIDTVQIPITPGYAGNHSMRITATPTLSDDDPSNNALNRHFTVGYRYYNCDTTANHTFGPGWSLSTDTSISKGSSCHVGNGQTGTYTNNMMTALVTPVMNMSDAVQSPLRTNGMSFYYTGSSAPNDVLKIYGADTMGAWVEIASLTGTVDQNFFDGANWQTFSFNDKGAASPLIPIQTTLFHSSSQFKFEFTSDASGTDMGFYIDEIVMVYDQKVRIHEFDVSAQGVATTGALAGEWGSVTVEIVNDGNITETFVPSVSGIPEGWGVYFARPSGTSFNPASGLTVTPGTPSAFKLMLNPDENASTGFQQMQIDIRSVQYSSVNTTLPVQFLVKADRIPVMTAPILRPSCPPTQSCAFNIEINNAGEATDVFDLSLNTSTLPPGWSVSLDWMQRTSVQVRPQQPEQVGLVMSVPASAAPDTLVQFSMTMAAQNDSRRTLTTMFDVAASMVSNASLVMTSYHTTDTVEVLPGETTLLSYTVTNHAPRQDIFDVRMQVENTGQWTVEQPSRPAMVLNSGSTSTFNVRITAPLTAQAGDRGPIITPIIESQRSLMTLEGEAFSGLRTGSVHDVAIDPVELPQRISPGGSNLLSFNVSNHGNGPASMHLMAEDLPTGWRYTLLLNDEQVNGSIDLTAIYGMQPYALVHVQLHVPPSEDAGARTTVRWSLSLGEDAEDTNLSNNVIEWTTVTAAVKIVELTDAVGSTRAEVGGTAFAEAVVSNIGNAPETTLAVHATVSASPPNPDLVALFSVNGADRNLAEQTPINVAAGGNTTFRVDLLIPDGMELNTRIVVRFEVLNAVDEEGLPVPMMVEQLVVVDQRRSISLTAIPANAGTTTWDGAALVWVNMTSTSTQTETFTLAANGPVDWQFSCQQRILNETGESFVIPPGHLDPQTERRLCEVVNLGTTWQGVVAFTISDDEQTVMAIASVELEFIQPEEPRSFASGAMLAGGGGLAIAIAIGLMFLRRKEPETSTDILNEPKVAPSLASAVMAGPPATTEATDTVSEEPVQHGTGPGYVEARQTMIEHGPPLPAEGLPPGWTMEQWRYYGQQYLDGTL